MSYDAIVIGSGAGGGTLTYALAMAGKKVLLLERGEFLPRTKATWSPQAVTREGRFQTDEQWLMPDGAPFHPIIHYWVGGNTKFYGAALLRLRERDFGEVRHAGGVSPAWPLSYAQFEPYYSRAEQLYHAHGRHGEDPLDPPASADYPHPPVSHEPRITRLDADLRALGYRPFHLPLGLMIDERNPRKSRCIRCNTCDGFACVVQGKADAHVVCVEPALDSGNVTLITGAKVLRLETSPSGRAVSEVVVERHGEEERYRADLIVLAAGALNSAAILLRSAGDRHPAGLANGSGLVGRNYMCHQNSTFLAVSREPNPSVYPKTLALSDFYFESAEWQYPMGFIQMLGKTNVEDLRFEAGDVTDEAELERLAAHSLDFWLQSEDLPDPDNRVTLSREGQIVLHYTRNNRAAHERLIAQLQRMLGPIGCEQQLYPVDRYLGTQFPFNLAHQAGTMRFGPGPATSVLDLHCKAHELDNLYVADASFFPSVGAVNPSLTIIANALRVGEHLIERMRG